MSMIAVLDGIRILVGVLVGADEYSLSRGRLLRMLFVVLFLEKSSDLKI